MLFEVNDKNNLASPEKANWNLAELDLEALIISGRIDQTNENIIDFFGDEELLIIDNQVGTSDKKRADILAIDKAGNGVVIELKKDKGQLGIETQALQYLADFTRYRGKDFLKKFLVDEEKREQVLGFLGGEIEEKDINKNNRIILVARYFDRTLYSMGEWLCSKNIGFKCISYDPFSINDRKFISFSIVFDKSPESLYPLQFSSLLRKPGIFWHNIGFNEDKWWHYLIEKKIITANYENQQGDKGENLLKSYIPGDIIIAYANNYGAVGYGKIEAEKEDDYQLIIPGTSEDIRDGMHLHRRSIKWEKYSKFVNEGIRPKDVKDKFGIHHPISASTGINSEKGKKLMEKMDQDF